MSLSDPIGDMIARVKNAQARNHKKVALPSSNFKKKIADILKNEGFIKDFKIDAEDIIVFHDDLDLEFGKVKAKFAGSSAGHNGIESIDKFIGKDYSRVRIGIGRPKTKADVADHVLKDFDEDEMIQLEKITKNIIDSMAILIDKKLDLFSSTVNNK